VRAGNKRLPIGLGIAVAAALLLIVPAAFGAELSRDEYVAKVEPICKANTKANVKIFAGVREMVKDDELGAAAKRFSAAAAALEKTVKQLKRVSPPAEDEVVLGKWLDAVEEEVGTLRKVAKALKAGQKGKAQTEVVRLKYRADVANNIAYEFEFDYCVFTPSRYF
jgi:molybdopterin converting factor small subunit